MVDYEPQHRAGRDARYRVPIRRIADALPERHQGPGLGHHRGLNQGRQQPVPHALTEDPESDHRPIAFTARWAVATPLSGRAASAVGPGVAVLPRIALQDLVQPPLIQQAPDLNDRLIIGRMETTRRQRIPLRILNGHPLLCTYGNSNIFKTEGHIKMLLISIPQVRKKNRYLFRVIFRHVTKNPGEY